MKIGKPITEEIKNALRFPKKVNPFDFTESIETSRTTMDIPKSLHKFYKYWAAEEKISFKELVLKSLVFYVQSSLLSPKGKELSDIQLVKHKKLLEAWSSLGTKQYAGLSIKDILRFEDYKLVSSEDPNDEDTVSET